MIYEMNKKARVIAFYLPQYHPIKENDEWWGKGFTEWTNVVKAKPLYRGHYQPHIPTDLGFYDLRLPETRIEQAKLAEEYGIEGFCYWHYWFGNGRVLLERPFNEVLISGEPDFPFCLAWANGSWTSKTWKNVKGAVSKATLIEQVYSEEDYVRHFYHVLSAFKDHRYISVDGKPLFYIHDPLQIPDIKHFITVWRSLASQNGLPGIYFVGRVNALSFWKIIDGKQIYTAKPNVDNVQSQYDELFGLGFDAVNSREKERAEYILSGSVLTLFDRIVAKFFNTGRIKRYDISKINRYLYPNEDRQESVIPTIIPTWDRTPRAGRSSTIYYNDTPEVFGLQIDKALDIIKDKRPEHRILFLQAWNEWAEGNHVEPDIKYGRGYLETLKSHIIG